MHIKAFSLLVLALLEMSVMTDRAFALDPNPGIYRSKASGDWNAASTWQILAGIVWVNAHSYPQAGDTATIRQHDVSLRQNEQTGWLAIEHGGRALTGANALTVTGHFGGHSGLSLESASGVYRCAQAIVGGGGSLVITGGGDTEIDGQIQLDSCAVLSFEGSNDYELEGGGSITGLDCTARIHIADGMAVVSQILIQGTMKIEEASGSGTATLSNKQYSATVGGIIRANGDGTLELASNLILDDITFISGLTFYRPRYEAVDSRTARLKFSHAADGWTAPALLGDVLIDDCAAMEFAQSVGIGGNFTHRAGAAIVAAGKMLLWDSGSYDEGCWVEGECECPGEADKCECD